MPECNRCDEFFHYWDDYDRHIEYSPNHNECASCQLDFPTWVGLKEHWVQSPNHHYCQQCDDHFMNRICLIDHYTRVHAYCATCNKVFKNHIGLKDHYRQSPYHYYCMACDINYSSESNLKAHLNSSIHRPKDVGCPAGCGAKFVSRSAVVLHLENGGCSSGINRETVNRVVRAYDKNNVITDPSRLIGGGSGTTQQVSYIATGASWNGRGYQCYLCDKVHNSLNALNQHLSSPRHQDQIYICRGPECGQRFRVLSALVAHIESEKCGISKFKYVQATMDNVLGRMPMLTY